MSRGWWLQRDFSGYAGERGNGVRMNCCTAFAGGADANDPCIHTYTDNNRDWEYTSKGVDASSERIHDVADSATRS